VQQTPHPTAISPDFQTSASTIAPNQPAPKSREQLTLPQKLALDAQKIADAQNRRVSPSSASLVGRQLQQGSTFISPIPTSANVAQHNTGVNLEQRRQQEPPAIPLAPHLQKQTTQAGPSANLSSPIQVQPSKEKKSGWARLGLGRLNKDEGDTDDSSSIHSFSSTASSSKKGKKGKKEKELAPSGLPEKRAAAPVQVVSPEKEKPESGGGFFGGLFGSKKKTEQVDANSLTSPGAKAAQQMHMPTPPPTASGMLTADGRYINFFRLPIHIERAVYRLSHIKLANPRRPLYEQVLISNLMFWYLGYEHLMLAHIFFLTRIPLNTDRVINKPAGQPSQQQQQRNAEAAVRAQAAKQAHTVNTEGFRQLAPAAIISGSPPSAIPQAASARPGLKRETSSPPPPLPEPRQRSQSDVDARPDPAQLSHPDAAPAQTRPMSHPPKLAYSAPSALLQHQEPYNTGGMAYSTASTVNSTPPDAPLPLSTSLFPEKNAHEGPLYNRRLSDEAGFQVARPQRSASIQGPQGVPTPRAGASIPMRDKATGQVLGSASFDDRQKTTDLEALDIISA
jgi:hypothetical protein